MLDMSGDFLHHNYNYGLGLYIYRLLYRICILFNYSRLGFGWNLFVTAEIISENYCVGLSNLKASNLFYLLMNLFCLSVICTRMITILQGILLV